MRVKVVLDPPWSRLAESFVFLPVFPRVRFRRGRASGSEIVTSPGRLFARHPSLPVVLSLSLPWTVGFGSPAARAALEYVSVVQKSIQHGGDGGAIA
jgi:hypothetical protein